jgi:hypothetical protein
MSEIPKLDGLPRLLITFRKAQRFDLITPGRSYITTNLSAGARASTLSLFTKFQTFIWRNVVIDGAARHEVHLVHTVD